MPAPRPSSEELDDLDALRRRLYRPDVTEEDRRAHALLRERIGEADPPVVPDGPAVTRRRHGPRRLLVGAVALAVAAVAAGAVLGARSAERTTSPSTPVSTARASAASIWAGSAPEIAVAVPTPIPVEHDGRRIVAQETLGAGSAVIPLRLETAPAHAGRLVVRLTSSDPSPVGWLAERPVAVPDGGGGLEVVASEPPVLRQGAAAPAVVAYEGPPPTLLVVRAPEGTGWTVSVAFLRSSEAH